MSFLCRSAVLVKMPRVITLDAGEPVLDLVEPGAVGRGEMHRDVRVIREKRFDGGGLES
jgi:hypothetical protein